MQGRFVNFSITHGKVLAGKFPVSAPFDENRFRDKRFSTPVFTFCRVFSDIFE